VRIVFLILQWSFMFGYLFDDLSIFAVQRYASAVLAIITSLCPSVCLSFTSLCSAKMAIPRITQTMPYDSPGILVCWCQRSWRNFSVVTPMRMPNRGGVGYSRQFTANILPYLRNGARYGHSYYGTLIGTRMCCIEWCYYQ